MGANETTILPGSDWWEGEGWYELCWESGYEEAVWARTPGRVRQAARLATSGQPSCVTYAGDGELPDPMARINSARLRGRAPYWREEYEAWLDEVGEEE